MIRRLRNQAGFTLAELLIVIAILGFMMGALFTLQRQGQLAYLVGAARVEVQQNARLALDMIISEIRSAQGVTSATGCGTAAGCTSITFTLVTEAALPQPRTIVYRLNGTDLERAEDGPATVPTAFVTVIGGVANLRIQTLDSATTLTSTPADVRSVLVALTTQTERGAAANSPGDQRAVVEGRVRLRNIL